MANCNKEERQEKKCEDCNCERRFEDEDGEVTGEDIVRQIADFLSKAYE